MVYAINLCTQEAEVGEFLWIPGQLGLHGKSQASQSEIYSETLSKNNNKNKQTKTNVAKLTEATSYLNMFTVPNTVRVLQCLITN